MFSVEFKPRNVVQGMSFIRLTNQIICTLSEKPPRASTGLVQPISAALAAGAGQSLASSGQALLLTGLTELALGGFLPGALITSERGGQRHDSRQQKQRGQGTAHGRRGVRAFWLSERSSRLKPARSGDWHWTVFVC